jgi:methylthioribulose-1-phosphate dehydratase
MTAPGPVAATRRVDSQESRSFSEVAACLAEFGRNFYGRGWLLGTSGNFSAVISREPLRLAITPSGVDKGMLAADQVLQIDGSGAVIQGSGRPSSETALHLVIVRRGAAAVLHTHSIWGTMLSEAYAGEGGITIEGYEMLKGLERVRTHQHSEWIPILENSQDMAALALSAEATLLRRVDIHGFLLRGHGLYTWGEDLAQAKRHVEILEFLLEVTGRTEGVGKSR